MTRNTTIIWVGGMLVLIMGFIVLKQHGEIQTLRWQLEMEATSVSPAEPSATPRPPDQIAPHAIVIPEMPVAEVIATQSTPASDSTASSAIDSIQHERESLQAQLQQVEAELERTKRLIPEPVDRASAYVGPGTWVNTKPQTRNITKVVIADVQVPSGPRTMSIKAWGACSPVDCEWPEVPFFLLSRPDPEPSYRRGFAVWDYEDGQRIYFFVTFEKSGLSIDQVGFKARRLALPYSALARMTRIE
jgi:hypothetical protein